MAINPPSDLVMDVARAADPQAYRMAAEKLRSAGAAPASAAGEGFVSFSDSLAAGVTLRRESGNPTNPAYRKFEAFMLQSFVQSMFTGDTGAAFGKGIAGEYWKSMMAEAMAGKMAEAGGVGIARMLENQAAHSALPSAAAPSMMALSTAALGGVTDRMAEGVSENAKDIVHGFERRLIQQQLQHNDGTNRARG